MKYPRTYHLPYSPGATKDDKKLQGEWFKYYKGKEIVITAKLDGENIHMTDKDCYALYNNYASNVLIHELMLTYHHIYLDNLKVYMD